MEQCKITDILPPPSENCSIPRSIGLLRHNFLIQSACNPSCRKGLLRRNPRVTSILATGRHLEPWLEQLPWPQLLRAPASSQPEPGPHPDLLLQQLRPRPPPSSSSKLCLVQVLWPPIFRLSPASPAQTASVL
jgi:hypothetical protein